MQLSIEADVPLCNMQRYPFDFAFLFESVILSTRLRWLYLCLYLTWCTASSGTIADVSHTGIMSQFHCLPGVRPRQVYQVGTPWHPLHVWMVRRNRWRAQYDHHRALVSDQAPAELGGDFEAQFEVSPL
jgi:hypothetical protein